MVKNLPIKPETWVQPLGQEDPLEEKMAIHSSISPWEILRIVEPGRHQTIRLQRGMGKQLTHTSNFKCVIVNFPLKYICCCFDANYPHH